MPNLRRTLPLATAVAALAFAPAAGAAVEISAPDQVTAPGNVRFSATASPDARVSFLVDGKKRWHTETGAAGLRRTGVVKLPIGTHQLEIRERRGTRVETKSHVTRVVSKPTKSTKGSTSTPPKNTAESPSTPISSPEAPVTTETPPTTVTPTAPETTTTTVTPPPTGTTTTTPPPTETTTSPVTPPPTESPTTTVTPPPTETTTPPVSQPTSAALFSSSAISSFQVEHEAPGAITEVPDPLGSGSKVIQMTVSDQDVYPITPTENPRAELVSQPLINPGQEVWLHTKFLIPSNYPTVPDGGWVSLVSFYGAPFNGPSPFHLELDGNQLQWQRNGTYNWDVPYKSTLVRGQWVDVLVHEKFATEGFLELWINGQQINFFTSGGYNPSRHAATTKLEMATMDASNNAAPNAAKIMQYRKVGMFSSGTIYFSGLQVGSTRSSVGA